MAQDQELIETLNDLLRRFNNGEKMIRNGDAVPTYTPRTFFDQFYIYESGSTRRLYVWINSTWISLSETDLSIYIKKDGSIAFTGDQALGNNKLTGVKNPTLDQDAATKKYVDDEVATKADEPVYAVGDKLINANDGANQHSNSSYTKAKETEIVKGGVLRIKFSMYTTAAPEAATGKIYRNGSPVGTEQTTNDTNPGEEFSEDIAGWSKGDLCQIYSHGTGGGGAVNIHSFRIYADYYEVATPII